MSNKCLDHVHDLPNLFSENCGIVAIPLFKYFGNNTNAVNSIAIAATNS